MFHNYPNYCESIRNGWDAKIKDFFEAMKEFKLRPTNTLFLTTFVWDSQFHPRLLPTLLEKVMLDNYDVKFIVVLTGEKYLTGKPLI